MTWENWLKQAQSRLHISGSSSPKKDAIILLSYITGAIYSYILTYGENVLQYNQYCMLEHLLARRETGEPIAYIIGEKEFWSLRLLVSPDTIIPRPDTECLVQVALSISLSDRAKILDLGTGTGAIALALAYERPTWNIIGIDFLPTIVNLAKRNSFLLEISNVKFFEGNWYELLNIHDYDLIVSNPPYIAENDPHLTMGDVYYEPSSALVSGIDGLKDLSIIIDQARSYLKPGGWLIVEHGYQQGKSVRELFRVANYNNIYTTKDHHQLERITQGQAYTSVCFIT